MGLTFAAPITEAKYGDLVAVDPERPEARISMDTVWLFLGWVGEGDVINAMVLGSAWSGNVVTFSSSGMVVVKP